MKHKTKEKTQRKLILKYAKLFCLAHKICCCKKICI